MNHEAINYIVEEYSDRLLRVALLITNDYHSAEDMVQECLVDAATHLEQFRGESSIYSWLYTILVRRCRRYRKKQWRLPRSLSDDIMGLFEGDSAGRDRLEDGLTVRRAIRTLPFRYREVVALFYYEQFSLEEIAEITNSPLGTVKNRLFRAREKLQVLLDGEV